MAAPTGLHGLETNELQQQNIFKDEIIKIITLQRDTAMRDLAAERMEMARMRMRDAQDDGRVNMNQQVR